ncbi:MAG: Ig-like domain-containing protein [Gemmatimonadaceae bacterium]|nr:Ig-like domain-containing protein [Gemmatimonadaceae bacterium]
MRVRANALARVVTRATTAAALRALPALAAATIVTACGGGGGGDGPTPPPPVRVPASVTFDNGSTVSGPVATAVPGTIAVTVKASDNLPLANTSVTFSVSSGTLSAASATTDASGRATAGTWTLGNTAGTQTLTATAGSVSAQLSATAIAGAPATMEIVTALPATIRAGAPIVPPPVVRTRDQFNNIVNRAGTVITASLQAGTGTLGGATATTDASGNATFSALTLGGLVSAGPRTIGFSTTGATTLTAPPVALEAGLTSTITLANVPGVARAGVPIAPGIVARLVDSFGNPMTRTTTVTASIASGGGTVNGATATTNAQGDATFASLSIEGVTGNRTLRFSADQVSATTGTIALAAGDAAELRVTSQPTVVQNTLPFPSAVQVRVTDRFGNGVSDAARGVAASIASGGGVLLGATSQTDAVGVASFPALRLIGSAGARTLAFTTAGLATATSAAIQLDAGPPRFVAFFQQPSGSITVGVPLLQQPALQLADTSGNIVRTEGATVRATPLDATGELLNDVAVTDAQGVARFEQLTFLSATSFPPPTMRLRFTSGAQAAVVTGNLTLQNAPGSAVQSIQYGTNSQRLFLLDPGATLNISATARDLLGNALPQVPIVYSSVNANAASVRASGNITGVAGGSSWVRAFGAGSPSIRDSVYVTVPRDPTAPIVTTTQIAPIPVRNGVTAGFDIVLDTRATTVGAATILVGIPNEVVAGVNAQALVGNVTVGLDAGLNTLRISLAAPSGLSGIVPIVRVTITSSTPFGFLFNREITINPYEMYDTNLQNLAPRSTGVNIPLVP